jgi:hypothetical protein
MKQPLNKWDFCQQLDRDDKIAVFKIVDTMLTKKSLKISSLKM